MKEEKDLFPNGFRSWMETFFEISSCINERLSITPESDASLYYHSHAVKIAETNGRCGSYDYAKQLADDFEETNKKREWDGEFFEEVEEYFNRIDFIPPTCANPTIDPSNLIDGGFHSYARKQK